MTGSAQPIRSYDYTGTQETELHPPVKVPWTTFAKDVPGRVGVPPERTATARRKGATQDAALGGQDAHPTRDPSLAGDAPVLIGETGTDKIWSAVLLATKPPTPKADPVALAEFVPRLKRIFGYTQYEIIGATTETIDEKSESWLVPSRNFWLQVKSHRLASKDARGTYLLNLQFFQDNRPILETEAKLAPGSPLFIRGPQYGAGQVIIVLQVLR